MDKKEINPEIETSRRLVYLGNCGARIEYAAKDMARDHKYASRLDDAEKCALTALAHIKELRASLTPQEQ